MQRGAGIEAGPGTTQGGNGPAASYAWPACSTLPAHPCKAVLRRGQCSPLRTSTSASPSKISSLVKQGLCNGVLALSQPAHRDVAGQAFGSGIGSEGGENGLEMRRRIITS